MFCPYPVPEGGNEGCWKLMWGVMKLGSNYLRSVMWQTLQRERVGEGWTGTWVITGECSLVARFHGREQVYKYILEFYNSAYYQAETDHYTGIFCQISRSSSSACMRVSQIISFINYLTSVFSQFSCGKCLVNWYFWMLKCLFNCHCMEPAAWMDQDRRSSGCQIIFVVKN